MKRFFSAILGVAVAFSISASSFAQEGKAIGKDSKVTLEYSLTVDGELIDSSEGKPPFQYVQGAGMVIPGLEKGLEGMRAGEEKEIVVSSADGYGDVNPQAFQKVPKATFPADMVLQPGMYVEMKSNDGQSFPALVAEVGAEEMTLNFNHPLAGKELRFKVKVTGVE